MFYNYNFNTKSIGYSDSADEYVGFVSVRAFKKVSK